jgi:hypothetical protein
VKTSRFSDSQIMAVLKQAEAGSPVPELCREHGISSATFYKWRTKFGGMDASLMARLRELTRSTANEYLNRWHLGQSRLLRQPPAIRFQAENSNDCWQFDLSPSDLKHIDKPDWIDPSRGMPTLILFSVVDDRSGVAYQEYRCVYGEDAESALRFLFNAMAPKADPSFPFQGRPKMIYLDNGPVAMRRVFQNVMQALGIEWQTHIPAGKDGTRTTARSKGKVERPFRTGAVRYSLQRIDRARTHVVVDRRSDQAGSHVGNAALWA